jgi:uncharacterized protein (TIGR02271 family)
MDSLNIREGATVYTSDGEKLGKVIALEGQYLVVEKGFFFPTDYSVPVNLVTSATDVDLYLSVTKDQALNGNWADTTGVIDTTTTTTTDTAPLAGAPRGDVAYADDLAAPTDTGYTADATTTGTVGAGYDTAGDVSTAATTGDVLRVPVHEEELTATKRPVEQGQVRITKDVVAEDRTLDVPVTEERVRVTRRAVDRDATDTADAFDEKTIDVPVRGEEVDVQKRVRVAEEVEVAKEAVQRTQRVADTVRREEVHIDDQTTDTGSVANS